MDSNHLHIFLEKILASGECPHCKARVALKNISIQSTTERTCVFKLHCDNCRNDVLAQAILNIENTQGVEQNISLHEIAPAKISEDDILAMNKLLSSDHQGGLVSFLNQK